MWLNLAVGSLVICGTVLIHVVGLLTVSRVTSSASAGASSHGGR